MEMSSVLGKPEVIWFVIGLILLIAEFGVPGLLIIFFGIGAWITALACLIFDPGLNMQIIIFIVSSVLALIFLRKSLKKIFNLGEQGKEDELEDEFLGKTAVVETVIEKNKPGKVTFNGTNWTSQADVKIEKGQVVKIIGKNNITLIVEPIETNNQ